MKSRINRGEHIDPAFRDQTDCELPMRLFREVVNPAVCILSDIQNLFCGIDIDLPRRCELPVGAGADEKSFFPKAEEYCFESNHQSGRTGVRVGDA